MSEQPFDALAWLRGEEKRLNSIWLPNHAARYKAAAAELEQKTKALEAIHSHIEMATPTGYRMSTVWNIADNALSGRGEKSNDQHR